MAGNEFSKAPQVEVGECLFRRCSDGSLLVNGRVRNGRKEAIGETVLSFTFQDGAGRPVRTASRRLEGVIPAGKRAKFLWRIPDCPAVTSFIAAVSGKSVPPPAGAFVEDLNAREDGLAAGAVRQARPAPAEAGAGEAASADRPAGRKADDPAPPKKPAAPPAPYTIAAEGLTWVSGTFRQVGGSRDLKYTGDTAFLKLRIADGEGNPAQPAEATVTVRITDRGQAKGFCKRRVRRTSWKLNAEMIDEKNARPEIVAFNAKEGTLWIGLVSAEDSNQLDLMLDVEVAFPRHGTWSVKGLRDPFKAPLQPPGRDR
jgi:hypothetical protein